jgi:hypothetical protein
MLTERTRRFSMALTAILCLALLAGGLPFQALPGASDEEEEWNLYEFNGTEFFKYDVNITDEEEGTQAGQFTLDLEPSEDGQITLAFSGELNGNTFESTSTVNNADEIMGTLMSQMMFNPAAAPLSFTLFAPWMTMFFMGAGFESGSSWSFTDEEGTQVSFNVGGECEHAGITGTQATMMENEEIRSEICISPDVALPLKIFFADDADDTYEITLTEYTE